MVDRYTIYDRGAFPVIYQICTCITTACTYVELLMKVKTCEFTPVGFGTYNEEDRCMWTDIN